MFYSYQYSIWPQCPTQGYHCTIFTWSRDSDLDFILKKFVHLSFKCKSDTSYAISNMSMPHCDSHKDLKLGLILSADLSWDKHHKTITARAYKVLGLMRWTFLSSHSTFTMVSCICITGPITITLLYSNMASTLNERYLNHWTCPVPCHQVHTRALITPAVIKLDWSN